MNCAFASHFPPCSRTRLRLEVVLIETSNRAPDEKRSDRAGPSCGLAGAERLCPKLSRHWAAQVTVQSRFLGIGREARAAKAQALLPRFAASTLPSSTRRINSE